MNLDALRNELMVAGWKDIQPGQAQGIQFDLVGSRRYTLTTWNVFVKALPMLDRAAVQQWQMSFDALSKASQSWVWGKCFLLCLVADQVAPDVVPSLSGDSFGLGGVLRLKGGGGNVLVADAGSGRVYGKVPTLPYDVHTFTKGLHDALLRAMRAGGQAMAPRGAQTIRAQAIAAPVAPAVAAAHCPACGQAVRAGAKFCDSCGAALQLTCHECHAELRPGAKFCDSCGAAVEAKD